MIALLASLILWPLYIAVSLVLWIVGLPVVYVLARRRAWTYRPSQYFDHSVFAWKYSWAWVYGNEEDGITGPEWFAEQHRTQSFQRRIFLWSALRNPSNNLRFLKINPVIEPGKIYYYGNSNDPTEITDADGIVKPFQWAFTWQGPYAGIVARWQIKPDRHAQVRIGWKFLPRDRFGVPDWDYRRIRCPFGVQLHLWRKS